MEPFRVKVLIFANTVRYAGSSGTDSLNLRSQAALPLDVRKGCAFPLWAQDLFMGGSEPSHSAYDLAPTADGGVLLTGSVGYSEFHGSDWALFANNLLLARLNPDGSLDAECPNECGPVEVCEARSSTVDAFEDRSNWNQRVSGLF